MKKASGRSAATIMELLRQDPTTGGLLPTAERLLQLQQDLNLLLPAGTAASCEVYVSSGDTLIVSAASAALAGKLRQMVPSLIAGLTQRGWKVNAIQLRVQPLNSLTNSNTYANGEEKPKRARLPSSALESWAELAETLEKSPLQEAVNALVRRRRVSRKPG